MPIKIGRQSYEASLKKILEKGEDYQIFRPFEVKKPKRHG